MKSKQRLCLLLCLVLIGSFFSGCGGSADTSTPKPETASPVGSAPDDEYERAGWYGFLDIDKVTEDAQITERDMVNMLSAMIGAYDKIALEKWSALTETTSTDGIYRDYGAMMLLYAAEVMDCASFTNGVDPLGVSGNDLFGQEIHGGYTLFEEYSVSWEEPCSVIADEEKGWSEINYLNASQAFAVSRLSLVTNRPLLESTDGHMRYAEPMTYEEAAIAVVRLYESCGTPASALLETDEARATATSLLAQAEQRRQAILNSETVVEYDGVAYYVSNGGNDSNDGKTPETAWASVDRVNRAHMNAGDAVFFERGGTWRATPVYTQVGVTYSAYGNGAKPRIISSPENGSGEEKWSLYYDGANGEKIWIFYKDMPECGALVLDGTEAAQKILGFWNGTQYLNFDGDDNNGVSDNFTDEELLNQPPFIVEEQLTEDLTFFNQADSNLPDTLPVYLTGWAGNEKLMNSAGPLYFRCDAGNPGALYREIEFLTSTGLFDDPASGCTLDNLFIGYGNGVNINQGVGVTVQNCEVAWVGGVVSSYALDSDTGYAKGIQRLADAVGTCSSETRIINNYIHELHHAGLGVEIFLEQKGGSAQNSENIQISGNLLYHCASGITFFNWDEEPNPNHMFKNCIFEDNYVLFTGLNDWLDSGDAPAFADVGGPNLQEGCAVINNVFFASRTPLVQIDTYVTEYLPDFEGNQYVQYAPAPIVWSVSGDYTGTFSSQDDVCGVLSDATGAVTMLYSSDWDKLSW